MAKADSRDDVVSASKAARTLGITVQSVVGRIKRGTLKAKKSGRGYAIPQSEVERLLRDRDSAFTELTEEAESVPVGVLSEDQGAHLVQQPPSRDAELEAVRQERDALIVQAERAEDKLVAAEQILEAARREQETLRETLDRSDRDIDHLRGLTIQQGDTMQNLTEEIKGLTIALHHEQGQRRELGAHAGDDAEDVESKRPGFLRRVFTGKPQRKRGKFARVGPVQTQAS